MPQPFRVPPTTPARLMVLASGAGTLLRSLMDAAVGDYPARVVAVGADRDCPATEIAAAASLPSFTVRLGDYPDRDAWDSAITAAGKMEAASQQVFAALDEIAATLEG